MKQSLCIICRLKSLPINLLIPYYLSIYTTYETTAHRSSIASFYCKHPLVFPIELPNIMITPEKSSLLLLPFFPCVCVYNILISLKEFYLIYMCHNTMYNQVVAIVNVD